MNTLPAPFEERMKKQLGSEAPAFFKALQTEAPVSIRLNPGKYREIHSIPLPGRQTSAVSWCENQFNFQQLHGSSQHNYL